MEKKTALNYIVALVVFLTFVLVITPALVKLAGG